MNDPIATSDELPELAQLLDVLKQLWSTLGSVLRVRAVIDSNAVIADLRYLATKRRNPKMRTYLQEVLAAGTLIGYARTFSGSRWSLTSTNWPSKVEEGCVVV